MSSRHSVSRLWKNIFELVFISRVDKYYKQPRDIIVSVVFMSMSMLLFATRQTFKPREIELNCVIEYGQRIESKKYTNRWLY